MQSLEEINHIIGNLEDPTLITENCPWGRWSVLGEAPEYKVKILEVAPGKRLSLQYHLYRSEYWFVVSGTARVVIGDKTLDIGPSESADIPVKMVHRIENPYAVPVVIIEVQMGDTLEEDDIVRLEDDYNRVTTVRGLTQ